MHKFKELIVWQKSIDLVKDVYRITWPSKRGTFWLNIANGSAFELETLLILCIELQYVSKTNYDLLNDKMQIVQKMVYNFKKSKLN